MASTNEYRFDERTTYVRECVEICISHSSMSSSGSCIISIGIGPIDTHNNRAVLNCIQTKWNVI